MRFAQM